MKNLYIGIDPSINSSGVCIITEDLGDPEIHNEQFYIIKPEPLTKKEDAAQLQVDNFMYITYNKEETTGDDNHANEINKTLNFINIINTANELIEAAKAKVTFDDDINVVWVCQEGISYGSSIRTKSIFDLAGFNFLLRKNFINKVDNLIIATPSEIKKFATGKGNANKAMMLEEFIKKFPELSVLPKNDDLADAYWMAKYAQVNYDI